MEQTQFLQIYSQTISSWWPRFWVGTHSSLHITSQLSVQDSRIHGSKINCHLCPQERMDGSAPPMPLHSWISLHLVSTNQMKLSCELLENSNSLQFNSSHAPHIYQPPRSPGGYTRNLGSLRVIFDGRCTCCQTIRRQHESIVPGPFRRYCAPKKPGFGMTLWPWMSHGSDILYILKSYGFRLGEKFQIGNMSRFSSKKWCSLLYGVRLGSKWWWPLRVKVDANSRRVITWTKYWLCCLNGGLGVDVGLFRQLIIHADSVRLSKTRIESQFLPQNGMIMATHSPD
jgi:hypothetical protein